MVDDWSFEDKKKILVILQKYGAGDYELLHQQMPEKSPAEIRDFCERHMEVALKKWENSRANKDSKAALRNWLTILKNINAAQTGKLTDILPRVLKYIALFEKRTNHHCINLTDCYLSLSDVSRGLPGKKIDDTSAYFFFECLTKLAKSINNGGAGPSMRYLKNLTNLQIFLEPEKQNVRKQRKFSDVSNPLSVGDNLLKMSQVEKNLVVFE